VVVNFSCCHPGKKLIERNGKEREGKEKGKRKEGKKKEEFSYLYNIINRRRAISLTIRRPLHNSGQPEKI